MSFSMRVYDGFFRAGGFKNMKNRAPPYAPDDGADVVWYYLSSSPYPPIPLPPFLFFFNPAGPLVTSW